MDLSTPFVRGTENTLDGRYIVGQHELSGQRRVART
jgi:hypothetical protein